MTRRVTSGSAGRSREGKLNLEGLKLAQAPRTYLKSILRLKRKARNLSKKEIQEKLVEIEQELEDILLK